MSTMAISRRTNYIFYLVTQEGVYEFDAIWARGAFIEKERREKGFCRGACYYRDKWTGELVFQNCTFGDVREYESPEAYRKAFREYFKDIMPRFEKEACFW